MAAALAQTLALNAAHRPRHSAAAGLGNLFAAFLAFLSAPPHQPVAHQLHAPYPICLL
jgi:hypothetical protein